MAPRTRAQTIHTESQKATRRDGKIVSSAGHNRSTKVTKRKGGVKKVAPRKISAEKSTRRASTPAICPILTLPNELLPFIINFCDQADLAALAHTCSRLYPHASLALYKDVTISNKIALNLLSVHHREQGSRFIEQIRSCEVHLLAQSKSDYWIESTNLIDVVEHMANLRSLLIQYDYPLIGEQKAEEKYLSLMPVPTKLASTLTSCTLCFKPRTCWPVQMAIPLLNHRPLKELILHSASSQLPPPDAGYLDLPPVEDIGKYGLTELVHLKLVDCHIRLAHLERILDCPRALRTLSFCSNSSLRKVLGAGQVNFEPLFKAISGSRSGQFIENLRMDTHYYAVAIVPAPGMHRFSAVRYFETIAPHLLKCHDPTATYQIPEIDVEAGELVPPNVEVLKLELGHVEFSLVMDFLTENAQFMPHLRKLILSIHYRDAGMSRELCEAEAKEVDPRHWLQTWEEKKSKFPVSATRRNEVEMVELGKRFGIEIIILHQDSIRKEVFREGAGPDLWEIPDQIS